MKQSFTSGEAASLCGLGVSTIKRWVRRGALKAYRTPGGDLRIRRDHLVDFMRQYEIPMHALQEMDGPGSLLIAVDAAKTAQAVEAAARSWIDPEDILRVDDDFDLGYALGTLKPAYVVLESRDAAVDARRFRHIREVLSPRPVRIGLVRAATSGESGVLDAGRAEAEAVAVADSEWAAAFLENLFGTEAARPPVRRAS